MKALTLPGESAISSPPLPVCEEGDVGGAAGQHVDDAVADHDRAAADHGVTLDLYEAAGAARDERAGIAERPVHEDRAAAQSLDQRAGADRGATQRQRPGAQNHCGDAGIDVAAGSSEGRPGTQLERGA